MSWVSKFPPGMDAAEFVASFVAAQPEIVGLSFCAFKPEPDVGERIVAALGPGGGWLQQTLQRLSVDRDVGGVVAAIIAGFERRGEAGTFVGQALRHDKASYREAEMRREEITTRAIAKVQDEAGADFVVGLKSTVRVHGGGVRHIPMIDFNCVPSPESLVFVKTALHEVGQRRGVVLNSGRSYHYYGLQLLSEEDWRRFLGRCLLLAPPVDVRYVAHRLIDGYCVLRVSANSRKPKVPSVVDVLDDARRGP